MLRAVLLGQLDDHGGQKQQADQVGDSHAGVKGIGNVPCKAQIHDSAHDYYDAEEDLIGLYDLGAKQILRAAGAVKTPAQYGRACEEGEAYGDDHGGILAVGHGEGRIGQLHTGGLAVLDGSAAHKYDQRGHGADNGGVGKYLEDAVEALLYGARGLRSGVGHRRGAKAGLVGEYAAGYAALHGLDDADAQRAAHYRRGVKRAHHDLTDDFGEVADVDKDKHEGGYDVDHCHYGDQLLGDLAYALDAADVGNEAYDSHYDTGYQSDGAFLTDGSGSNGGNSGSDRGSDGVHLGDVADAEGANAAQHSEHAAQPCPLLAKAVPDVVHGAAYPVALIVLFTILGGESDLGELGCHAQESGNFHPEHRAGAAEGDSAGNAYDVTCAYRCGEGRGDRLHRSYGALLGFYLLAFVEHLSDGILHCIAEVPELEEVQLDGHVDAGADDEDQHGDAPHNTVHGTVDGHNFVH